MALGVHHIAGRILQAGRIWILQAGRIWVIASLGRRLTTRVIVMPGFAPLERGPNRWLRHPNYLVVELGIAVMPLALGLPVFALVFAVINAVLLVYRIHVENHALAWAQQQIRTNLDVQRRHSCQ